MDAMTYPNATNTGVQAGTNLTTYNGQLTLSTPGQVVSGLIITGGVEITASNVTLKDCIIEVPNNANWNVGIAGGLTGVVLQNCEIVGAGTSGTLGSYGIYVRGNSQVTINAVNMHDVGQGLVLNDGQVTLENSYIHDLNAGSGTHYEDVGYFGDAKSSTFSLNIQNNTLINQRNQTASVFLQNYFGGLNNITVNNNVLVGGDYTIYVDGSASSAPVSNVSITNNHMGAGIYGITDFMKSSPVYTGNVNDGATLAAALATGTTTIPTTLPTVTGVSTSPATGAELPGNTIGLTINLNEAVTVTGTPTLSLNDGGTATYTGGSGSNALTFRYVVSTNDTSVAALAITKVNLPTGSAIKDANGNAANLAGALVTFSGLQIDPPSSSPKLISMMELPASGDLNAGKTVSLTLKLSEAVTVAGGTPTLTLNDGGTATYTGGSGTNALTFSYAVATGQNTSSLAVTAVNLNAATVKDGAGNNANLALSGLTQSGPQIDTTMPTVSSVVTSGTGITNGSGALNAGKTVSLTLKLSEAVTVAGGTPTLTLNDGGTATYTGGSGTNALTFSYTVAAGQTTSDLTVTALKLNSATVTDGAGNTANLSGAITNPAGTLQISTTVGTTKVIQTDGSTSLTEVANQYYLYGSSGTGPALKYNGANVTAGEFGSWTPIGAVQTASGYDVAWKNTSTGQYTVWTTDSSGNYEGDIGAVSGTSSALETMEPVLHQDLNGDGVVGLYAAPGKTLQISQSLAGTSGSATIGTRSTLELTAADFGFGDFRQQHRNVAT